MPRKRLDDEAIKDLEIRTKRGDDALRETDTMYHFGFQMPDLVIPDDWKAQIRRAGHGNKKPRKWLKFGLKCSEDGTCVIPMSEGDLIRILSQYRHHLATRDNDEVKWEYNPPLVQAKSFEWAWCPQEQEVSASFGQDWALLAGTQELIETVGFLRIDRIYMCDDSTIGFRFRTSRP